MGARRAARSAGGRVEHVQLPERALKLFPVVRRGREPLQRVHGGVDDGLNRRTQRFRHLVMHPHAVAARVDQTGLAQIGQMA